MDLGEFHDNTSAQIELLGRWVMSVFCGFCGTELDSSARFCFACGKALAVASGPLQAGSQSTAQDPREEGPRSSRRRLILAGLLAVLLLMAGAAAFLLTGVWKGENTAQPVPTASTFGSTPASPPFEEADAERLGIALSSGEPDQVASVIEVSDGVDIAGVADEMLPDDTQVIIDAATFVDFGGGFGAVEATLSGGLDGTVTLFLHEVEGGWLVSGTSEPVVVP